MGNVLSIGEGDNTPVCHLNVAHAPGSRFVADSRVTLLKTMEGAWTLSDAFGNLLEWMDAASCLAAERHCGRSMVTLVMDDLDFTSEAISLLAHGGTCVLEGKVTRAFGTSVEVVVNVYLTDLDNGMFRTACNAYFMYVVLKTEEEKVKMTKIEVPTMVPYTSEEHLEFDLANRRRAFRVQRDQKVQEMSEELELVRAERGSCLVVDTASFTELVLPLHANHMGNTFGGQIMAWMVKGAAAAVWLYVRRKALRCVDSEVGVGGLPQLTVQKLKDASLRPLGIDQVHFKNPSHVGDRVQVEARVTRVFESSIEVHVRVTSAAVNAQDSPTEVNVGFFSFGVFASDGKSLCGAVPDLKPQTGEESACHRRAEARQRLRHLRRETGSRTSFDLSPSTAFVVDFEPESHQAEEIALRCLSDIIQMRDKPEAWSALHTHCSGIEASVQHSTPHSDGKTLLKIKLTIDCLPHCCYDLIRDISHRSEWDQSFLSFKDRHAVGDCGEMIRVTKVMRNVLGKVISGDICPTQFEDFLMVRAWGEVRAHGCFAVAQRSVRCDSKGHCDGRALGEQLPSGFIIEPAEGSSCCLTFLGQFNVTFENLLHTPEVDILRKLRERLQAPPKTD